MNNTLEVADVYPHRHRLRVAKGFAPLCPVCIVDEADEFVYLPMIVQGANDD